MSQQIHRLKNFSPVALSGEERRKRYNLRSSFSAPTIRKNVAGFFHSLDLFGQPIQLVYNGANGSGSTYRTAFGGVMTIVAIGMAILIAVTNLQNKKSRMDEQLAFLTSELSRLDTNFEALRREIANNSPLSSEYTSAPTTTPVRSEVFGKLDALVTGIVMWLFFESLTLGPIIRRIIAKPLWLAEMGCNLFYILNQQHGDLLESSADSEEEEHDDQRFFEQKIFVEKLAQAQKSGIKSSLFNSKVKINMDTDNIISSRKKKKIDKSQGESRVVYPRILIDDQGNLHKFEKPMEGVAKSHDSKTLFKESSMHHMKVSSSMQFDKSTSNLLMSNRNSNDSRSFLLPDIESSPQETTRAGQQYEGGEIQWTSLKTLSFYKPSFSGAFHLLFAPSKMESDVLFQIERKLEYSMDILTHLRTQYEAQALLSEGGILGLTDLQKSMLNFHSRRVVKPFLRAQSGFDDDLMLTEEYMQTCMSTWAKSLDRLKYELDTHEGSDLSRFSKVILNDYSEQRASTSLNSRLISGLPDRPKHFLQTKVRGFEASYLTKAQSQSPPPKLSASQSVSYSPQKSKMTILETPIDTPVRMAEQIEKASKTEAKEPVPQETMSFKLAPEVASREKSKEIPKPLGNSAEFNGTNSSRPRVGTQELSELERELDDIQGKKFRSKEAIEIVQGFEDEIDKKKNKTIQEPPVNVGPEEPTVEAADPPKEIKEIPTEEEEQFNSQGGSGGTQMGGVTMRLKAKNNVSKNFNPLRAQKTNMGDLKSKMTAKNMADKPDNGKITEINEDDEEEDDEEELKPPSQLEKSVMNEKQRIPTTATRQQEGEQATDIDRQSSSRATTTQNPKESKMVFDRLFNQDDGLSLEEEKTPIEEQKTMGRKSERMSKHSNSQQFPDRKGEEVPPKKEMKELQSLVIEDGDPLPEKSMEVVGQKSGFKKNQLEKDLEQEIEGVLGQ